MNSLPKQTVHKECQDLFSLKKKKKKKELSSAAVVIDALRVNMVSTIVCCQYAIQIITPSITDLRPSA